MSRFVTFAALGSMAAFAIGCAHTDQASGAYERVTVATLHASPQSWNGRKVEVSGIAVRQFENYGLYASRGDMCSRQPIAIYVRWDSANLPDRFRRPATVRGVFNNLQGVTLPSGDILISNAAPGPGPLENVEVVRWNGQELAACSSR